MQNAFPRILIAVSALAFAVVVNPARAGSQAGGANAEGAQKADVAKREAKYRLVLHVAGNNPQEWKIALNNALLFQKNLGADKTAIELVANGPGLHMLKAESAAAAGVTQALDHNIDIVACGQTMKAMKLTQADLIGGVRVVPGGLIEIVNRQMQGWSYVRP